MSYKMKMKKNDYLNKNIRDKKREMLLNLLNNYQFKNIIPPKINENKLHNNKNHESTIRLNPPNLKSFEVKKQFEGGKKLLLKKQELKEDRLLKLRKKFILTAKKFIGIPYGRKYLEEHPYYTGSLFLDCCGLVRKAVNTMANDFGFQLGKWNQCYQYDILPKPIPFNKMKPGDLIFYTAEYYPDKCKKQQIHNVVHVEIFLGEGEKTIGSRDSKGVVQIYDTFQFSSENYFNIEYHFKSIDTWLKGIHKSFCREHLWNRSNLSIDKGYNLNNNFNLNYGRCYLPIAPNSIKEHCEKNEYVEFIDLENEDDKCRYSGFSESLLANIKKNNRENNKDKSKKKNKMYESLEESRNEFQNDDDSFY